MRKYWSNEEIEYLRSIAKGKSRKELVSLMAEKFGEQYTLQQLKGVMWRNKIKCEYGDGRFKKGHIPHNTGTKGVMKPNRTSFKKGCIPNNWRPIGSERITKDGYIEIKIAENKWRLKHRVIYEQHFGPIPKNKNIIFADRNKRNLDIDNLLLITKGQLSVMNKNKLIYADPEKTKVGVNIASLMIAIKDKSKKGKK